jgi:hypothetical protein
LDRLRRKRKKRFVFGFSEETHLVSSKLFYRFPAIQAIKNKKNKKHIVMSLSIREVRGWTYQPPQGQGNSS